MSRADIFQFFCFQISRFKMKKTSSIWSIWNHQEHIIPASVWKDFLMFLRRSYFYMTISVSHAFLLIFWGVWGTKFPRKFWRIFRLFFNIFVSVKLFLRFFIFLTRRGSYREFLLTFYWLFDVWKTLMGVCNDILPP